MSDNNLSSDFPIELPNYQFKKLLERGGMGAVYLAEQQQPKRDVVIKVVAPNNLAAADPTIVQSVLSMLQNEGNVAARFDHENLIRVIECGVLDDHYFLAMEYLPGGNLRERLGAGLSPEDACSIIGNVASGLAELHGQGVLHRDIKPENILFRKNGKPVLMDYGIAKDEGTVSKLTKLGLSAGTPEYMSPEQLEERPIDARSDLYALGVLFYELLTGQVPFPGRRAMAIAYKQVNHPVPPLPPALRDYQGIIDRLLAKEPNDRYQSAGEVIAALDLHQAEPSTGAATKATLLEGASRPGITVIGELKRRKVLRTAGVYGVTAFGITEILTFIFESFGVPLWANRLVASFFVAGFPIAMFLSWVFDVEPGGRIKRTRSKGHSTTPIVAVAMVLLIAATGGLFYLIFPEAEPVTKIAEPDLAVEAPAPANTIAVLAFTNMSSDKEQEYFADGLSDTLIHLLAQVGSLKVTAKTSSFAFKGQGDATITRIAEELAVANILAGSVQKAGNEIRVTAQLIDTASDTHLWSDSWDRDLTDVFAIQDEIAREVVKALKVTLLESEEQRLAQRHEPSLEAYEQLILGRRELAERNAKSLAAAEQHFKAAIELDPEYALAYVGLADTYGLQILYANITRQESLVRRQPLIEKALELDPLAAEAYATRGYFLFERALEDWDAAEQDFLKAIELNPNYATAHHWYAGLLGGQERFEEALQRYRIAAELDPLSAIIQSALAYSVRNVGKFDEALDLFRRNLERNPGFGPSTEGISSLLSSLGRLGAAQWWIREGRKHNPIDPNLWTMECFGFLNLGDPLSAENCVNQLSEVHPKKMQTFWARFWLQVYRGEYNEVISTLEALSERSSGRNLTWFLAESIVRQGDIQRAWSLMSDAFPEYLEDGVELAVSDLGSARTFAALLHAKGETQRRDVLLLAMEKRVATLHRTGSFGYDPWDIWIHAMRGDRDQAIAGLRKAIDVGWKKFWWTLRPDWKLGDLRQDPEFIALMNELEADILIQRQWYEENKDKPLSDIDF